MISEIVIEIMSCQSTQSLFQSRHERRRAILF